MQGTVTLDRAGLQELLDLQREVLERLRRLETPAAQLWYSPAEIARLIRRRPATVRGWCRQGRILARKRLTGRGNTLDWEISAEALEWLRCHGLLPKGAKHA